MAQGHQPWRSSPVDVADLYLRDRGIGAEVDTFSPTASGAGDVDYRQGGVVGTVHLARPAGAVVVVVGSDTSRLTGIHVERSGGRVRVELTSAAAGTVRALVGRFASEWSCEDAQPAGPGTIVRLTLDTGDSEPLLLRLRHEGSDGVTTVAERRVDPS